MAATLKDVVGFIKQQVTSRYYGTGLKAAQMRDETYDSDEGYRQLVSDAAPVLCREGEIIQWARCQNARRTPQDDFQLNFSTLPNAPTEFTELKRQNYVPRGNEETDEGDGCHLEPENMTQEDILSSAKFYHRSGLQTMRRGEVLMALAKYREAMGIPDSMTMKEWVKKRNRT